MKQILVTVVSGLVGAGKTALVQRILAAREGKKVAVLTADLGVGDQEFGLAESGPPRTRGDERALPLPAATPRCRSREHFALELRKLGRAKDYDYLVVESTGVSEPLPVAETFAVDDGRGTPIDRYAKVDAMVTIVSAQTFLEDFASADFLADRGLAASPTDERHVVEALVAQVEFADVLVIGKVDVVDEKRVSEVEALLRALNPRARIVRGASGQVPLGEVLDTGLFDFGAATEFTGTARYFADAEQSPAPGYTSFGYRRFRPFHPQRFEDLVHGEWTGVLRSKGIYWVASRLDTAGEWSQAGKALRHATAGSFWAATPEKDWEVGLERRAKIKSVWQEPFGDRRQELGFLVESGKRAALEAQLDACLLTDEEMALGPEAWKTLPGHDYHGHDHDHDHGHEHHGHEHHEHAHEKFVGHTPHGGHHSN
jgi:G3E family GTPase